jgi:hypothetical protein
MYSLLFLICLANGQCSSATPSVVYPSQVSCEMAANALIVENMQRVERGETNPHTAIFVCHSWGTPS